MPVRQGHTGEGTEIGIAPENVILLEAGVIRDIPDPGPAILETCQMVHQT